MTTPDQARAIAAELGKAASRALCRIGTDWTPEGSPGPARKDAYSLGWGKGGHFGLIEKHSIGVDINSTHWAYRLTALGQAVRAILQEQRNG